MEEIKQHKTLLGILALLLVVKLALVPLIEWQELTAQENHSKQRKLNKIEGLFDSKEEVTKIDEELLLALQSAEQLLFEFQNESDFQLSQQKYIESLLETHDLELENFGWQSSLELKESGIKKLQMQLRVTGSIYELVDFVAKLEQLEKRYEVIAMNINFSRNSSSFRGARLTLGIFMRTQES